MTTAVLIATDRGVLARLSRLDAEFGLTWVGPDEVDRADGADLVVIDLADPDALDKVRAARERWPVATIAGYLDMPDPERWTAGQRAGCDLVANKGALAVRLRPVLAGAGSEGRTFPLLAEADLAGRLGLVGRVAETPVGPVAIYQVDGKVQVVGDRCPHAGAVLSEGELDQRIITCPGHGSQFDVCTGERLRGPADADIPRFRAVVADGQVSLLLT